MKTAEETQAFLSQMDRSADTGDPDDDAGDPDDLDTADPDDGDTADPDDGDTADPDDGDTADPDDGDTAGPSVKASGTAQIKAMINLFMKKNGGKPPTRAQLQGLLQHVHRKATRKRPPPPRAATPPPRPRLDIRRPPTPKVHAFRKNVFAQFKRTYPETVTCKGYYYSTSEVVFSGVGDTNAASLMLQPSTIQFFHEAIDDNVSRLKDDQGNNGIAHLVNPGETNLQNPGQNLYPNEVFIITHVGLEFCGMRVLYDPATVKGLNLNQTMTEILTGTGTLWDDGKVLLPGEILNDFDGRCRLVDAMYPSGVLYFCWNKKQSGGSKDIQELLINTMQKIPVSRAALMESSGGASLLEMNEGYVWSLDQQTSSQRSGIFEARLRTHERVAFPIQPVEIAGKKLIPVRLAVLLRMTVYGDAIRPKDDVIKPPEARARR